MKCQTSGIGCTQVLRMECVVCCKCPTTEMQISAEFRDRARMDVPVPKCTIKCHLCAGCASRVNPDMCLVGWDEQSCIDALADEVLICTEDDDYITDGYDSGDSHSRYYMRNADY